jgi:hypothetical protein
MEDMSPLNAANAIAAALAAAAAAGGSNGSNGSNGGSRVVYIPSMLSRGLSSNAAAADGGFLGGSSSRGVACRPAPVCLRLAVVSGWGESDPRFAPPLVQRRVARWLRHKLADSKAPTVKGLTPAAAAAGSSHAAFGSASSGGWQVAGAGHHIHSNGHAWGASQQQQGQSELQLVPLDGSSDTQQQQGRTWAGVVRGGGSGSASQQQQQGRQVLQLCEGVELLSSRVATVPGPVGSEVTVELLDVVPSQLDRACGGWGGSSGSNGGSSGAAGVLQGCCGVVLLVSGPDGRELTAVVKMLGLLLEHCGPVAAAGAAAGAGGVAVPLTVLACTGAGQG